VLLVRELVLFWESKTTGDEMSPTKNVLGVNACPAWCSGKIPDPKTNRPLLLTLQYLKSGNDEGSLTPIISFVSLLMKWCKNI
jgi:hypothetical protein